MVPYTYLIKCIPTGELYYGVRYMKSCQPDELWKTYFTSSKLVKERIKLFGVDNFEFSVRRIFKTGEQARLWETKVLRRLDVINKSIWLNQSIGVPFFKRSNQTDKKSIYLIETGTYKFVNRLLAEVLESMGICEIKGKKKPKEFGKKISKAQKGKPKSPEHVAKGVESRKNNPNNHGFKVYTNGINNIKILDNDTIPDGYYLGSKIKGISHPNKYRDMSYEEIYGIEKANQLKNVRSEFLKNNNPGRKMEGKTYEELYGEEKAKELKLKRSESFKKNNQKIYIIYFNNKECFCGSRLEAEAYLHTTHSGCKNNNLYNKVWLLENNIKVDIRYMNR